MSSLANALTAGNYCDSLTYLSAVSASISSFVPADRGPNLDHLEEEALSGLPTLMARNWQLDTENHRKRLRDSPTASNQGGPLTKIMLHGLSFQPVKENTLTEAFVNINRNGQTQVDESFDEALGNAPSRSKTNSTHLNAMAMETEIDGPFVSSAKPTNPISRITAPPLTAAHARTNAKTPHPVTVATSLPNPYLRGAQTRQEWLDEPSPLVSNVDEANMDHWRTVNRTESRVVVVTVPDNSPGLKASLNCQVIARIIKILFPTNNTPPRCVIPLYVATGKHSFPLVIHGLRTYEVEILIKLQVWNKPDITFFAHPVENFASPFLMTIIGFDIEESVFATVDEPNALIASTIRKHRDNIPDDVPDSEAVDFVIDSLMVKTFDVGVKDTTMELPVFNMYCAQPTAVPTHLTKWLHVVRLADICDPTYGTASLHTFPGRYCTYCGEYNHPHGIEGWHNPPSSPQHANRNTTHTPTRGRGNGRGGANRGGCGSRGN
ncbi:hypothetical protein CPB83DRAFT_864491 [Crepidotus variabilis]|uniref:Uncharacterized protein n=1 Tax=Crepidotus variabilis TaxID=179855 RepID=A0A9P6E4S8_9AGAR|nr:hypothetical protein CPB83DRAFT_864491 [Crepidotus variabilis]